jgi:NitT/TauT family transport system substrate-binding protein
MLVLCLCTLVAGPTLAAEKLILQLKWVPQSQFAGYYAAQGRGFYAEEGLDVEIRAGGPKIDPAKIAAAGQADVIVDWMPSALEAREHGVPLVNIAQPFKRSASALACRRDRGIMVPEDLRGNTIALPLNSDDSFLAWMANLGIPVDGGSEGVTMIERGAYDAAELLSGAADCIRVTMYNEYWLLLETGFTSQDMTVFRFEDEGVATLEDGLYVVEGRLQDPALVDRMVRFVRASMRGWAWSLENLDAAVGVVMEQAPKGATTIDHQRHMLEIVGGLLATESWRLDPADYDRTVSILLRSPSHPVISKRPDHAWTHRITDAVDSR